MKVSIDEVRRTLEEKIVLKGGFSKKDAVILANDYLEGELQGKKSHGLAAFTAVAEMLSEKQTPLKIMKESASALYIDAENGFGSLVGQKTVDILLEKAKKQGVAAAYIRNMKSWLRPATIAQYIAANDMVGFVTNTGGPPMVAPPGGKDPAVGTNPIGLGIPGSGRPVIADMATSKRAWGEVRLAKRFGHDLPPESYYDKNGHIAIKPDDAYSALPMGDYKGFVLGLMIEIMGGSFVGMQMGEGDVNEPYYIRPRGATILIVNPDFTVGADKFKKQNQAFLDKIRQSSPLPDGEGVTIPGDRAAKTKNENIKAGSLEIDDQLWREIKAI